jgi:hypothetical protein
MRNSNIGSISASNLFNALTYNNSLELLDLANNQIGDNSAATLVRMVKEKHGYFRLTIVLRCNQISSAGYLKIKDALLWHL